MRSFIKILEHIEKMHLLRENIYSEKKRGGETQDRRYRTGPVKKLIKRQ